MRSPLTWLFLFLLSTHNLYSQGNPDFDAAKNRPDFQKLYVQTDREIYFLGDTIWLSAYLLDAKTHIPVKNDQNLHVDLIDSTGTIVKSEIFPVCNGFGEGNIPIADSVLTGNFVFRAYTNYLRNFGDDSYFYKSLPIERTKNSFEIEDDAPDENNRSEVEPLVRFFPEGGILLEHTPNIIGVKITGKNGESINTNGVVLNEDKKTVARFETNYKGLGKFDFYPNSGEKYTVVLNAFPRLKVAFWEPEEEGIKLQLYNNSEDLLHVGILSNSKNYLREKYTLACMNRGEVIFYKKVKPSQNDFSVKIEKTKFGAGINRLVLLNEDLNPVSERLYFNNHVETNSIRVALQDQVYSNRSLVNFKLIPDEKFLSDSVRLSVAVVNENSLNAFGESQTMLSQLYLDAELIGRIESPADYFNDEPEISSEQKLDLLMLTHGWSSYFWNKIEDSDEKDFKYPLTAGFTIEGYVTNLWNKKRVGNSEVLLMVQNDSLFTSWETTDEEGRFVFQHINLADSAAITLQARKSDESENTRVTLEPLTTISAAFNPNIFKQYSERNKIPLELYRQNYYASMAEKEFEPEKDVIMIDVVEVTANAPEQEEVKFSQIYSEPDIMIKPKEGDFMANYLEDFLLEKAPAFFGNNMPMSLLGGSAKFSFIVYLDGILWTNEFNPILPPISVSNIDRVDIIDTHNPTGMALLGSRGSGGAVFIYTKRGAPDEVREKHLKGVIKQKINGFSKYREFYSPIYTAENRNSEKPDYRTTLYWNPSVKLYNGEANISFFTSDDIARYKVLVEGITTTGTVCFGEMNFEVTPEAEN
ncbi:hypothetical protein [Draconibacterium sediminis]|uniref:TonB-dependent receptor plug domain-containing protein n=1 Tax=Draconibacterium sediminis TaxID=1544798 RepID=A0A0D8JC76_9BACT|nr:hypothetical protein [Draconibacterium sediminis]KJF44527.1 hypothetical protein LH29_03325 [Draconibacterium sediminis]